MSMSIDSMLELLFNFSFYLIIGSFGAFLKDLHETLTDKNERIRLGEIFIGGVSATFICLLLRDKWLADASVNLMMFICFVIGILGFEIFGNITSISKLKSFVKDIYILRTQTPDKWNERDERVKVVDNESVEPTTDENRTSEKNEDTSRHRNNRDNE